MSLRIAVISTPRTGSTWLCMLLMDAYGIPGFAVHRPDDLNWAGLPAECVVNLHWRRTPALVNRLHEKGFRVVCCMRHPLDILISILQLGWHDDSSLQWLDGEGGSERSIHGVMPGSAAFLEYAAGPRAAALMAVSREWTSAPESLPVRYEDLVADGEGELKRIAEALGEPTRRQIGEVVEGATIPKLRVRTQVACHFWQGRPGLWRSLLVSPAVERLAEVHHAYCAELGYSCAADPLLVAAQADANWLALTWPQVTEKLRAYRPLGQELAEARDEFRRLEGEYAAKTRSNEELIRNNEELIRNNEELTKGNADLTKGIAELTKGNTDLVKAYQELLDYCRFVERSHKETQTTLQATRKEHIEATQADKERLRGLGPTSLAMARWLAGLSHRFPGPASTAKRLLHLNKPENSAVCEEAG